MSLMAKFFELLKIETHLAAREHVDPLQPLALALKDRRLAELEALMVTMFTWQEHTRHLMPNSLLQIQVTPFEMNVDHRCWDWKGPYRLWCAEQSINEQAARTEASIEAGAEEEDVRIV